MKRTRVFGAACLGALLLAAVVVLSPGCASTNASATADTGKGGAQLWGDNCASCHNTRSPSAYSDAEWDVAMQHMRVRANLTGEEHRKILEFLKAGN